MGFPVPVPKHRVFCCNFPPNSGQPDYV